MIKPLALSLMFVSATTGCFVSSSEDMSWVRLGLALDSPRPKVQRLSERKYWDAQDRFHLKDFPKYVRAGIVLDDYELATASWPDRRQGIGSFGEGPEGQIQIEMQVAPGTGRRLHALGFVSLAEGVRVYQGQEAPLLDLTTGQDLELTLSMIPSPSGTVVVSLICENGSGQDWRPTAFSLIDLQAAVVFPPVALQADLSLGAFSQVLTGVPVGRLFASGVFLTQQGSGTQRYLEIVKPTIKIERTGESQTFRLSIPCP
jgi:hypothetical protein